MLTGGSGGSTGDAPLLDEEDESVVTTQRLGDATAPDGVAAPAAASDRVRGRHRWGSRTTRFLVSRPICNTRWWTAAVALTVGVVALSILLGGHRRADPHFDVSDEAAHYAYVLALRSGHLPAFGDTLTVQDRKMADCLSAGVPPPAKCGKTPPSARHYAADGYDYEAQQPPLGYLPYVATADPGATPVDAIAAARTGGMIWVAISGGLLLALACLEELSLLALAALLATCLLNPIFTLAAATVNNDAAGVAAGAVALIAWSWSRRRPRWSLGLGLLAGVLLGLTKGILIVVPFALVIAAVVEEGRGLVSWSGLWGASKRHLCTITMLLATAAAYGGFVLLQDSRATVAPSAVLHALLGVSQTATVQPSTVSTGLSSSLSFFEPYYPYDALNVLWDVCVLGVLVGVWAFKMPEAVGGRVRGVALGVLAGMVVLAVGWPVLVYIQGHYNYFSSVRYNVALLPLIAYVIVKGCRNFGVAAVGVALPLACAALQLGVGKY